MRSLKFRIWKKSIKKYIDLTTFTITNNGDITAVVDSNILEPALNKDDYILEQYTGLKDKNDKEIYEGDIIKARWYRAKHARLNTKGEVKFDNGWFYIYDDPDGQDRLGVPVHNCYDLEVISNIHEVAFLSESGRGISYIRGDEK